VLVLELLQVLQQHHLHFRRALPVRQRQVLRQHRLHHLPRLLPVIDQHNSR
jgi:hypothetical protein